jgi:hypothetical protein
VHYYCQQRAITPDPESLNSNIIGAKLPLLSAEGCHTQLDGSIALRAFFSRVKKPSDDINRRLFFMNKKGLRIFLKSVATKVMCMLYCMLGSSGDSDLASA